MNGTCCSCCGQPLPEVRLGVRLSPLKARIFDALHRAGPDGIDADTLFWLIFSERKVTRSTLKSHVNQINDLLAGTDYRIKGTRGGGRRFTLVRREYNESGVAFKAAAHGALARHEGNLLDL